MCHCCRQFHASGLLTPGTSRLLVPDGLDVAPPFMVSFGGDRWILLCGRCRVPGEEYWRRDNMSPNDGNFEPNGWPARSMAAHIDEAASSDDPPDNTTPNAMVA